MQEAIKQVQVIRPLAEYAKNAGIIRVAAYCRVSTDSEDQVNSFLNQVQYYSDFIRSSDKMELVDIYADEGITGTSVNKREDFKRMMKDARLGKIDRIYVKSIQRFARNSLECLEAVRKLTSYGVSVLFENDRIDTSRMSSEMMLYIKSAFAQNDSMSFSKRMSVSYRMRMEEGTFITYHAPYGYRLKEGRLVIVPEEADVVKQIFQMYLAGKNSDQIVVALNEKVTKANGERWGRYHVRYMLSNEKYVGDSLLQKCFTPEELPLKKKRNRGEKDQYYVHNSHPAIIDRQMYEAVQARLKERGRYKKSTIQKADLFSRMIVCGDCGWIYKRRVQNGTVYWVCSHKGNAGFECGSKNLSEKAIQTAFVMMYNRLRQYEQIVIDETLAKLIQVRTRLMSNSSEIAQIDAEIAKLCSQSEMYVKLNAMGIMDLVSFEEQVAELQNRTATLRSRRIKLMGEDEDTHCMGELRALKENLQKYPSAILSFDETLFRLITEQIKVGNDGTVTFILKGGLHLREKAGAVS